MSTCSRPLLLRQEKFSPVTGELLSSTDFNKNCGSRLFEKCPHCSEIYKRDARTVISSGFTHSPMTFITLTAPGSEVFGKTHNRIERKRKNGSSYLQRCPCGHYHNYPDDRLLGTSIGADYDYTGAAAFNAGASRLLTVTMQKLSRISGRKIERVRVAEYQKRGLIHFHILVKGVITERSFKAAVHGGKNLRTGRSLAPASHNGWSWGVQIDIKIIPPGSSKMTVYLAKLLNYSIKSIGSQNTSPTLHDWKMRNAGRLSVGCKNPYCWHKHPCRRHRLAETGAGFRGHVLSVSRNWGILFKDVRARRQKYHQPINVKSQLITRWKILPYRSPPPVMV